METIAIDLDEIRFDFINPFLSFANQQLGTSWTKFHLTTYSFSGSGMMSVEQNKALLEQFTREGRFKNLPIITGSTKGFRELQKHYNLIAVTSRPIEAKHDTIQRFKEDGFEDIPILFSHKGYRKYQILHDISANYFIDDHPTYIEEACRKGPRNCINILFNPIVQNGSLSDMMFTDWNELLEFLMPHKGSD